MLLFHSLDMCEEQNQSVLEDTLCLTCEFSFTDEVVFLITVSVKQRWPNRSSRLMGTMRLL